MNRFEKQLKKEASKVRMRASEREHMREQIVSFMEYHPLTANQSTSTRARRTLHVLTPYMDRFVTVPFSSWHVRGAVGVALFFILVGVPLQAEKTVPGDILYPVKVRINEEVLGTLSFSSYEKVAWETHRVERRIAEARLLAKEGRLTDEAEQVITDSVKEHTENARKELAILREEDAEEAAVAEIVVASALEVQSAVLHTEMSETSDEPQAEDSSIEELAAVVSDAQATLTSPEPQEPSVAGYEKFLARIEESTSRARDLEASLADVMTEEERGEIKRRLEDIERKFGDAKSSYDANSTATALDGLKEVLRDTQKLIVFMTDIDVRTSITLEALVPKELTVEERRELVRIGREEIAKHVSIIESRLASTTAPGIARKVNDGLDQIREQVNIIDAGLSEGGSLENAENAEMEASALTADLLVLTEPFSDSNIPLKPTPETAPTETSSSTADGGEVAGATDQAESIDTEN